VRTPEAVASSEAARLFLDRALAVTPGFEITAQNAEDIARVCQRLDGIPLALELAAARVKVLSVGQIAERLDDALRLLTSGARLAPARQQTLRAALAWSYALLPEPEQLLFDRLSVFAGGWTLEAAEVVCSSDGVELGWVLDGLARLVDKSLVIAERSDLLPVRYRLLEPVRQFAEERLVERGERDRMRDSHADFFIRLAQQSEDEIHRAPAIQVMNMLDREHDNVRVALRWLISLGDVERSQRLAGGMSRFWLYRSHVAEGEAWLRQVLELPGGDEVTVHRWSCLSSLPVFAVTRGDHLTLEKDSQEELRLCRALGDRFNEGFALVHLGQAYRLRGDFDRARELFNAGVAVARETGCSAAETLNWVALANVALEQGRYDEAGANAEAALTSASEEGWTRGYSQALRVLGQVCHNRGDDVRARELLEQSLEFARRFGARWWVAGTLIQLGILALDLGELTEAREWLAEGLQVAYELGDWPDLVTALDAFARLATALDRPPVGVQLSAAADAIRRERRLLGATPLDDSEPAGALRVEESVAVALSL
jgi:tetratricopeptide (TPR) repeat protein